MKSESGGALATDLYNKLSALSITNFPINDIENDYSLDNLRIQLAGYESSSLADVIPPPCNDFKSKKPFKQTVPGSDIIAAWFNRGMHLILERVFLNMPIKSLQTCLSVNSEWQQIVQYYLSNQTCNSRLIRLREFRLAQEWLGKKPNLKTVILAGYRIDKCFHILVDSRNIVIAAMAYKVDERSGMIKLQSKLDIRKFPFALFHDMSNNLISHFSFFSSKDLQLEQQKSGIDPGFGRIRVFGMLNLFL
jgi:hypothetical protein